MLKRVVQIILAVCLSATAAYAERKPLNIVDDLATGRARQIQLVGDVEYGTSIWIVPIPRGRLFLTYMSCTERVEFTFDAHIPGEKWIFQAGERHFATPRYIDNRTGERNLMVNIYPPPSVSGFHCELILVKY